MIKREGLINEKVVKINNILNTKKSIKSEKNVR